MGARRDAAAAPGARSGPPGWRAAVRPELARIVATPAVRSARRLGLLAAGGGRVQVVAGELALALAAVTRARVLVLDVMGRWGTAGAPAADALALAEPTAGLVEFLALSPSVPGRRVPALAAALDAATGHAVVDLSGLEESGEHLEAAAILDAVALVAVAGEVTTPELGRWMRELPAAKNLGVLLVGRGAGP